VKEDVIKYLKYQLQQGKLIPIRYITITKIIMIDFKTKICKGGDGRRKLTEQEQRRKDVEYQIRERAPEGAPCSSLLL
jgi:hypothetical protein